MHHLIQDKVNLTFKKKFPFLFVKFPTSTTKFDSLYEINLNLVSINSSNWCLIHQVNLGLDIIKQNYLIDI